MQIIRISFLSFFLAGCLTATGQDTAPNSLQSGQKHVVYAPKSFKKAKAVKRKKANVKHTPQYEFYERVERVAREKQRILKKLSKAQYADPHYFGHKKIPRRRPPWKMRYCDVCGIRH